MSAFRHFRQLFVKRAQPVGQPLCQRRVMCPIMVGERRQRLQPAALDPAIGSVGAAQSVGGAIVLSGQSIDLGVQKCAVQGRAGQHPFQRFAVGIFS